MDRDWGNKRNAVDCSRLTISVISKDPKVPPYCQVSKKVDHFRGTEFWEKSRRSDWFLWYWIKLIPSKHYSSIESVGQVQLRVGFSIRKSSVFIWGKKLADWGALGRRSCFWYRELAMLKTIYPRTRPRGQKLPLTVLFGARWPISDLFNWRIWLDLLLNDSLCCWHYS